MQFIIHSVVYYLFLADRIPPLAGDADGDPAPPCKKRNQYINTFIERFHSHATRKVVLDKTSASTGLVWNTIMGAVALFCEERNCRNDERK